MEQESNRLVVARRGQEYPAREEREGAPTARMPDIRVNNLCEETRTVYEFMGCHWHGHTCMAFRDTPMACGGDTLAERYE
jgi:G:T-mismatch repair DNA endonuclease (very short patch repair protein)